MPAHLKSLLTQSNLTMSIKNKKILLGTWQGIFLLEHRYQQKNRELFFHLLGE
jgi:secondary thiamine-phosphate synthase enzyme